MVTFHEKSGQKAEKEIGFTQRLLKKQVKKLEA
jgi:hypothetical protein